MLLIIGLAINDSTVWSRLLAAPAFVLLGEASYALYLAHFPAAPLRGALSGDTFQDLVRYAFFTALVIALSIGLHMTIEKPARLAIRRLLAARVPGHVADAKR